MYNSGTTSMLISSTCRYFTSDGEFQESRKKAKVKITEVQDVKAFSQLQNITLSPLVKTLEKNQPTWLHSLISLLEDRTLWRKVTGWLPAQPMPQLWFCFMMEEICLPPSCLYQVLHIAQEGCISPATPEEDSTTLGISLSNPDAFYLISIHTLFSLPIPHILKLTSTDNTMPTVTWWRSIRCLGSPSNKC